MKIPNIIAIAAGTITGTTAAAPDADLKAAAASFGAALVVYLLQAAFKWLRNR